MDSYKVEQLKKMLNREFESVKEGGPYGASLYHATAEGTNHLTIDAGGLNSLIQYYSVFDTDLERLGDFDARKEWEFNYILKFAALSRFTDEMSCKHLRGFWTTYCMHWGIDVRSVQHADELMKVWDRILIHNHKDSICWKDFVSFTLYITGDMPQE